MLLQICSRFSREYEQETGIPVGFRLSFGGSGTQVGECSIEKDG